MGIIIEASAAIYTNGTIIFFDEIRKYFFKMDYKSGRVSCLAKVADASNWWNFGHPCEIGNKLYFPPVNYDSIIVLSGEKVLNRPITYALDSQWKFSNVVGFGMELYFLPRTAQGIICLNLETGCQTVLDGWWPEYLSKVPDECRKRKKFAKSRYGNYLVKGRIIHVPLMFAPIILEIDRETKETKLKCLDVEETEGFLAIYEDKLQHKYLLSKQNNFIIELEGDKMVDKHSCFMDGDTFGRSLKFQNFILILGFKTSQMVIFNIVTKETTTYILRNSLEQKQSPMKARYSCMIKVAEDKFLAFNKEEGSFWIAKGYEGWEKIKFYKLEIMLEKADKIILEENRKYGYTREDDFVTLRTFINNGISRTNYDEKKGKLFGTTIINNMKEVLQNEPC